MTSEQEDKLIWTCISPANNREDPSYSDGYNEGEVYGACVNVLRKFKESQEYLRMKEKADKWDNYEEEIESLHRKLSANCEKVDKWDILVGRLRDQAEKYTADGELSWETIVTSVVTGLTNG